MAYMSRDVEVVPIDEQNCIVVSCDSCGAIGSKELDVVKVPAYIVGRFTARVALLEVLAVGATPLALTVATANEPEPTTRDILHGVQDELKSLALNQIPVVISSEKNVNTKQTGLGLSVTGLGQQAAMRIATSRSKDNLYCLGLPKVGSQVQDPEDPDIIQGTHILALMKNPQVHDIIPVGSRGIRGEAASLAAQVGCRLELSNKDCLDLDQSGGPSTCALFSCSAEFIPNGFSVPLFQIGRLICE